MDSQLMEAGRPGGRVDIPRGAPAEPPPLARCTAELDKDIRSTLIKSADDTES